MNAERLLALYEKVAEAPDAVPRLRRFVLDLAVRGKLLNAEIEWGACTLGDVGRWGSGGTPTRTNPDYYGGTIPWLVIGDLNDGVVNRAETHITQAGLENSSAKLIDPGTVMIAMYGSIGKLGIAGVRCTTNQAIAHCVPDQSIVSTDFFLILLRSLREDFLSKGQGVAQQNISQKILKAWPVQLPLLAEQRRIVGSVEELMALLDRLEAARTAREATRDRLTAASLARLTAPDTDTADFPANARFALATLPALTTRPDQIKPLRQTILNLAVRGKLVEQDPADEPASQLLKRLARKKAKQGKGRNWSKGEAPTDGLAFEAPHGWAWTTIDQTALRVTVGHVGPMKDKYVNEGVPFLRSQNVRANAFRPDGLTFISPEFHQKIIKSALAPGDVVVVRSGNVGTACLIPPDLPVANCSDLVVIQSPEAVVPQYLCFYLNSLASVHVESGAVGVALTHFNTKSVATMPFPLPPLSEQHRVVAKVDALMALCDRLEAALTTADTTRARLLEVLLHDTLTPTAAREMEAAE